MAETLTHQRHGAVVIDAREHMAFAAGHLQGSVNVGLGGRFAEYTGEVMAPRTPIVLITPPGHEAEAKVRLARIGFDRVVGALEHPVDTLAVAHQVDAADDAARPTRHLDADRLADVPRRRLDQPLRDDALADGGVLADVEVLEEQVERADALGEAALQVVPLGGRDEPRDQVERPRPLRAGLLAVDRERDALAAQDALDERRATGHVLRGQRVQSLEQALVVGSRAVLGQHLAEALWHVAGEQPLHRREDYPRGRSPWGPDRCCLGTIRVTGRWRRRPDSGGVRPGLHAVLAVVREEHDPRADLRE